MTQPYQIDREAVLRPIVGIENRTAQEVFDIMCDRIRRRPAPMEAVAWRESVRQRVAEIVEAAIERHVPTTSLRHTLGDADAILSVISTNPVQGGEG